VSPITVADQVLITSMSDDAQYVSRTGAYIQWELRGKISKTLVIRIRQIVGVRP